MAKITWLQIFATIFQLITPTSGKRYFINNSVWLLKIRNHCGTYINQFIFRNNILNSIVTKQGQHGFPVYGVEGDSKSSRTVF